MKVTKSITIDSKLDIPTYLYNKDYGISRILTSFSQLNGRVLCSVELGVFVRAEDGSVTNHVLVSELVDEHPLKVLGRCLELYKEFLQSNSLI